MIYALVAVGLYAALATYGWIYNVRSAVSWREKFINERSLLLDLQTQSGWAVKSVTPVGPT